MAQKTTFYPVVGGLDETTQAIAVARGKCIGCLNHESVQQGYGRVSGFERFDGQTSPTAAFNAQVSQDEAPIDRENARSLIRPVPGTGPVRGVWNLSGQIYAWRDAIDLSRCDMWRATTNGWEPVSLGHVVGFHSGGPTSEILAGEMITTATGSARVRKVVLTDGNWPDGDAAGYLFLDAPSGSLELGQQVTVGADADVAMLTADAAPQTFPAGGRYQFETHNFYASASMRCFYGVNGVGRGFEVDVDGNVFTVFANPVELLDVPVAVTVHRDHLFFGYANGSIIHSQVGEPHIWDGAMGATEIGVGSPITGFASAPGGSLFVFSETKIDALHGQGIDDWTIEAVTDEGGGYRYTMQRANQLLYMDNSGVRSVQAARDFGNFKMATLTAAIENTLQLKQKRGVVPTASCVVKDKTQYRIFFDDGSGISIFFGRKYPECMNFAWPNAVAFCATTTKEELGQERVFIGATNGFVYELEKGTSFDGEAIEAYIQFPFDHEGGPLILKKWHKITFEMVAEPGTEIAISAEFDYSGVDQPGLGLTNLNVAGGGGGIWSIHAWDEFYWSSPVAGIAENWIDGQGFNMSLIVVSTSTEQMPYIIQGVSKSFSVRGQKR